MEIVTKAARKATIKKAMNIVIFSNLEPKSNMKTPKTMKMIAISIAS
jgi:hypothetical protein